MEDEYFRILPNDPIRMTGYSEGDLTSPACAYRGAQWLDIVRPTWPLLITEKIQLLTFDKCVCGQVFREEVIEGGEGYLYAHQRYGHEWDALVPWHLQHPNTAKYMPPGIYLGFKGGIGAEIAWMKEQGIRKSGLLMKELGL